MATKRCFPAVFGAALIQLSQLCAGCDSWKGDPNLSRYPLVADLAAADLVAPVDLASACPPGATCWDFSKMTTASLTSQQWMLDSCWQVSNGALSNLQFPDATKPFDSSCSAFLPSTVSSGTGRYQLKISHSANIVSATGDDVGGGSAKVFLYLPGASKQQVLLAVQVHGAQSEVTFSVPSGLTFQVYLRLQALAYSTLNAGVWQIQRLQLNPTS